MMRIKNGLIPQLAEVGKIKIGGKGKPFKNKKGYDSQMPVRFDYFVVTGTIKGQDGNFLKDDEIMQKLGNKPKEIKIRLPFDDIDKNFMTSFAYYYGKKCVCRGDGETAKRIKDGKTETIECPNQLCKHLQSGKCKVSGILSCFISGADDFGGVYRFRTHSWNSVSNILASLQYITANTGGVLMGLPLKLKMIKKPTAEHGDVNIVTIVLDGVEMSKFRQLAATEKQNRELLGVDILKIENYAVDTGFLNDTDSPADISDEFYPEQIETIKTEIIEPTEADIMDSVLNDLPDPTVKTPTEKTEKKPSIKGLGIF